MDMLLNFEGPFSYKDFKINHPKNSDLPGVYFWGFRNLQYSANRIQEPVIDHLGELNITFEQMMSQLPFFPYYVGIHQKSIFERVNNHFKNIHNNNTYIIFEDYVYPRLPDFLKKVTRQPHPQISALGDVILYSNDKDFFIKRYNILDKAKGTNSATIDKSNGNSNIQNTIEKIYSPENIMLCFAQFPKNNVRSANKYLELTQEEKTHLRNIEVAVKFCLRINTLGWSKNIVETDNISISFKQNPSTKDNPYLDLYMFYKQKDGMIDYDPINKRYFALV